MSGPWNSLKVSLDSCRLHDIANTRWRGKNILERQELSCRYEARKKAEELAGVCVLECS